jgi:hypothetical protein
LPPGRIAAVTDLLKAGIGKEEVVTMGRELTGKLLMG